MTKRYLTHFLVISVLHLLALIVTKRGDIFESSSDELSQDYGEKMKVQITLDASPKPLPLVKNENKTSIKPTDASSVSDISQEEENLTSQRSMSSAEFYKVSQQETNQISNYYSELRSLIEKNKFYPPASKRLGQTGTVVVAFTLLSEGNIINVRIENPSKYDLLNDSALNAVRKVRHFKPFPMELNEASVDFKIPIKFFTI